MILVEAVNGTISGGVTSTCLGGPIVIGTHAVGALVLFTIYRFRVSRFCRLQCKTLICIIALVSTQSPSHVRSPNLLLRQRLGAYCHAAIYAGSCLTSCQIIGRYHWGTLRSPPQLSCQFVCLTFPAFLFPYRLRRDLLVLFCCSICLSLLHTSPGPCFLGRSWRSFKLSYIQLLRCA